MAITRISRTFKDISLSFTPHPVTKDLPVLKNENSIVRSVRSLVTGCGVKDRLISLNVLDIRVIAI
jgi:hypothetical protein